MEFFRIIEIKTTATTIQEKIHPLTVDHFTETMLFLEKKNSNFKGVTLWGEFLISYNKIKGGVRFALLDCPNALSWTITTGFPPEQYKIIIHCTINRFQQSAQFVKELHEFLDEWETKIKINF